MKILKAIAITEEFETNYIRNDILGEKWYVGRDKDRLYTQGDGYNATMSVKAMTSKDWYPCDCNGDDSKIYLVMGA